MTNSSQGTGTNALSAAGTYPLGDFTVNRVGYGAMRLSGPGIYGPPADPQTALQVLRDAVAAGVNHIDTSDFYGPHVTNRLIREALHPYREGLVIVTKVGAKRTPDKAWPPAMTPDELRQAVHDNLDNLGLKQLDVVNLRVPYEAPGFDVQEPLRVLVELQEQGLIRHLGLSNVTPEQFAQGQQVAPIVCVQNAYNVIQRGDDAFIDELARQGVAYVPYFPLGGFSPLQSGVLDEVAASVGSTPMGVALAWLRGRSPNMLLIPGTSSSAHLRENLTGAAMTLPEEAVARLNGLAE